MSDYPNGPYHCYWHARPNQPEVCEVHGRAVAFAGDEFTRLLEDILWRAKLVRLVEVEQQQPSAGAKEANGEHIDNKGESR